MTTDSKSNTQNQYADCKPKHLGPKRPGSLFAPHTKPHETTNEVGSCLESKDWRSSFSNLAS